VAVLPVQLLARVDAMSGQEFEHVVGQLFRHNGYSVELTARYDYGADLIVRKDGVSTAVQAKRWGQRVGENAVRAAHAGRTAYSCDKAMVVATNEFTRRAIAAAKLLDVELWGRLTLAREIQWLCAVCGSRVTAAERRWCLMKHDRFGGNVYCRPHQAPVVSYGYPVSRTSTSSARSASGGAP
jgi:hypothetical protein